MPKVRQYESECLSLSNLDFSKSVYKPQALYTTYCSLSTYFWTIVFLDNCVIGQKSLGQLSPWTIAPWTIVATPKLRLPNYTFFLL